MDFSARVDCEECGEFDIFTIKDSFDLFDIEIWVSEHDCGGGSRVRLTPVPGPHLVRELEEPK